MNAIFRTLDGGLFEREIPTALPTYRSAIAARHSATWLDEPAAKCDTPAAYRTRTYELIGIARGWDTQYAVYVEQPE